jgi:VanZ family protein
LSAGLIAYFSLYPWQFSPTHTEILRGFTAPAGRGPYVDAVVNVIFYVPLGLFGALTAEGGERRGRRLLTLGLAGAALSLVMEILQAWIPARESAIQDVVLNTVGTIVGAALAPRVRQRVITTRPSFVSSATPMGMMFLMLAWITGQWFPFLPILRAGRFHQSLERFTNTGDLTWLLVAETFLASWIIARLLRQAFTGATAAVTLLLAALAIPARLLLIVQSSPWPLTIAGGVGVLTGARNVTDLRAEARRLAVLALLLIAAKELYPWSLVPSQDPFPWVPFTDFLGAARDAAIRVTCEKLFLYGATIWTLRESGLSPWISMGAVVGLLSAGEAAQLYLPGRVAESTDPMLALAAGIVVLGAGLWRSPS